MTRRSLLLPFSPSIPDAAGLGMRVVSVREPGATLIVEHGRDIENRMQNIAGGYSGPVGSHVAGSTAPKDAPAWKIAEDAGMTFTRDDFRPGCIIGVVDLVDVTRLSPPSAGGELRAHWRLHLENPHALRRLEKHLVAEILEQLADAGAPPRAPARMVDIDD